MILSTQCRLFLCPKSANKKQIGNDPIISVVDIIVVVGVAIVVDIARVITIVIVGRTQPPPAGQAGWHNGSFCHLQPISAGLSPVDTVVLLASLAIHLFR